MIAIKLLISIIILFVIPLIFGIGFNSIFHLDKMSVAACYILGIFSVYALFQVVCIPLIIVKASFNILVILFSILVLAILIIILWKFRTKFLILFNNMVVFLKKVSWIKIVVLIMLAVILILQMILYHVELDDAEFVTLSTSAIKTNTLFGFDPYTGQPWKEIYAKRVIAPYSLYVALCSKLCMVHPAIMSHTILPVFLFIAGFMTYYVLARQLFGNHEGKIWTFVGLVAVIIVFSGFSTRALGAMFALRIWQGKAIVASIALPLLFCYLYDFVRRNRIRFEQWWGMFIIILGMTLTTAMADWLIPIEMAGFSLVYMIKNKSIIKGVMMILMSLPAIFLCGVYFIC